MPVSAKKRTKKPAVRPKKPRNPKTKPKAARGRGRPKEWTLDRAMELGTNIWAWMTEKQEAPKLVGDKIVLPKERIVPAKFFDTPQAAEAGYYIDLPSQLCKDYPDFRLLWERVGTLAENRIVELGLYGEINARFAQFYLERKRAGFAPPAQKQEHSGEVGIRATGLVVNFVEHAVEGP